MKTVHIFEPTGYSGIFQHACQLAEILSTRTEMKVVLHSSQQHEHGFDDGLFICQCSWWPRNTRYGLIGTLLKRSAIAARLLFFTLPHLLVSFSPGSVVHVQGAGGLNFLVLWAARFRRCKVVYSPHDTFARRGRLEGWFTRLAYRPAQAIVVYSYADQMKLRKFGSRVYVSPLVMKVPQPLSRQVESWRRDWQAERPGEAVVLCAGFLRPDKRLDLLIQSARSWPIRRHLAVVGEDRGAWSECARLAETYGVSIAARIGFVDLTEFAAAIAAADLVVVPAEQASQSAVLVLARKLGTPTVAADIGGLGELASRTFRAGNVDDLTAAIGAELDSPSPIGPLAEDELAAISHLCAYGLAREQESPQKAVDDKHGPGPVPGVSGIL